MCKIINDTCTLVRLLMTRAISTGSIKSRIYIFIFNDYQWSGKRKWIITIYEQWPSGDYYSLIQSQTQKFCVKNWFLDELRDKKSARRLLRFIRFLHTYIHIKQRTIFSKRITNHKIKYRKKYEYVIVDNK